MKSINTCSRLNFHSHLSMGGLAHLLSCDTKCCITICAIPDKSLQISITILLWIYRWITSTTQHNAASRRRMHFTRSKKRKEKREHQGLTHRHGIRSPTFISIRTLN